MCEGVAWFQLTVKFISVKYKRRRKYLNSLKLLSESRCPGQRLRGSSFKSSFGVNTVTETT